MTRLRVVIVDDHPLFREGLSAVLGDADMDVVGQASTGEEALEMVARTDPDVVLMDLHMPGIGGVEATRQLLADRPHVAVLVLTMMTDDATIAAALRAGARGYLLKEAEPQEIMPRHHLGCRGQRGVRRGHRRPSPPKGERRR